MADMQRRPSAGGRGDVGDLLGGGVRTEDIPGQLRRRRVTAQRLEPLESGRRDPLDPIEEPISDAELDSWRAAWCHLDRMGLPPVVPHRVLAAAGRKR